MSACRLTSTPLELEAMAQATLAAAAVVAVPCFASRRHGCGSASAGPPLFVGAAALLMRLDRETAARVAPTASAWRCRWRRGLLVYLLALGGVTYTVDDAPSSTGAERLRGWGLLLFGSPG